MPSPVEVYEKVEAEIGKRFREQVEVVYVDMDEPIPTEAEAMADRILAEDRWLPVIVVKDEILAEGVLRIRDLLQALERLGILEKQK